MGDRINNNTSSSGKRPYTDTMSPLEKYRQTEDFKQSLEEHRKSLIESGLGRFVNKTNPDGQPSFKKRSSD